MLVIMKICSLFIHQYSALEAGLAGTRAQSFYRYGSGILHPGQVLGGCLPLLSPPYIHIYDAWCLKFKWTRPFRRKTKPGSFACAMTFQLASAWLKCLLPARQYRHSAACQQNQFRTYRTKTRRKTKTETNCKWTGTPPNHWKLKSNRTKKPRR